MERPENMDFADSGRMARVTDMAENSILDEEIQGLEQGRVLIVSDSHSRHEHLEDVMERVAPDLMLHLGDSEDYEDLIEAEAPCPVVIVRGNCDYGRGLPDQEIVRLGKHRAFLCHGHRHNVRFDLEMLARAAKENGCDVAMYGHTHEPEITEEDGVTIYNPGSISLPRQDGRKPSFIVLDIDENGELHPALNFIERKGNALPKQNEKKKKRGWFW